MKQEFSKKPDTFSQIEVLNMGLFSWEDFLTAIPSPLFVVTTYKANDKENACLQSWSTFVGDKGVFLCIIGSVTKNGHLYQTLRETKCCVLNFPSQDIYKKCALTIRNNGDDDDEITKSGLTAEKAVSINAPRIKECFLNIECEYLWEHEHYPGSDEVTVALKTKHVCMDTIKLDESKVGRYGKTGYMYNIHSPTNPATGEVTPDCIGALEKYNTEGIW